MKLFKSIIALFILLISFNLYALDVVKLDPGYFPQTSIGRPVANGYFYVGIKDLDPSILANQKQVTVRQESGVEVQIAQPVDLSAGGVPEYLDSPVTVLVDGVYSLKVFDFYDVQVYYIPESAESISSLIGYDHNADGSHIIYESIADLRATTLTPFAGQVVKVVGYDAGTENKGWFFKWNSTSTVSDDSGINIKVTAITTGRYERIYNDNIYLSWFGPNADDINSDAAIIKVAADIASGLELKLIIEAGTYYIADPGITLLDNTFIEGTENTFLRCERTYFDDSGVGIAQYTVGQGNVFNADSATNITIKNITILGNYESSWGNQYVYSNQVPATEGSHLLFFIDCDNIVLDGFKIKESFSSNVLNTGTFEQGVEQVYGYNQIWLTRCDYVKLLNCSWTESIGEAWSMWDCYDVVVDKFTYDCDYGVSAIDITYSTKVRVTNSNFYKRLSSDSGDLLNVASFDVSISGCHLQNGNIDVGNEFLNVTSTLGQSFLVGNIVVDGCTTYNAGVTMAVGTNASTLDYVLENIHISDLTTIIDLDNRPAANGTTVLTTPALRFPNRFDVRNISAQDIDIIFKGALQDGGVAPPASTYNVPRLIDLSMSAAGYTREGITIKDIRIKSDITSYDPDDINDSSGAIYIKYGDWIDLTIEGVESDFPIGMTFERPESMLKTKITSNKFKSENFLNMPNLSVAFDITDLDIENNTFNFLNTAGHNYVSSDLVTRGFGLFISMYGATGTDIVRSNIVNNRINAPSLASISLNSTPTDYQIDVKVERNNVLFVDYGTLDVGATRYQLRLGKSNTNNDHSAFRLLDNYFVNNSASLSAIFILAEYSILDMLRNEYLGDYTITLDTDNVAGDANSRAFLMDNIAVGTTITTSITNVNSAVSRISLRNSTVLGFAAVTTTVATDP